MVLDCYNLVAPASKVLFGGLWSSPSVLSYAILKLPIQHSAGSSSSIFTAFYELPWLKGSYGQSEGQAALGTQGLVSVLQF